jgi:hypothetical protein
MNTFPQEKKLPTSHSAIESTRKTHSLLQSFLSFFFSDFLPAHFSNWLTLSHKTDLNSSSGSSIHPPTHLPTQPREDKTQTSKAKKCSKTVNCKRCANKAFGDCR